MKRGWTILTVTGVAAMVAIAGLTLAQGQPTTTPTPGPGPGAGAGTKAASTGQLSPMIVKDVKEMKGFLYGSTRTTLKEIAQTASKILTPLMDKATLKDVSIGGGPVFVYHGITGAPDAPFDLEIGVPVNADANPVGDFKVKAVPGFRAATAYYTGPITAIGQAVPKLYAELFKAGYRPTDQYRELYLHWDGENEPNNVVELQIGIAEK